MTNAPAEGNVPEFDMADRLRKALRHADVGVQEIADYLGVSRNTVGAWINGRTPPTKAYVRLWAMRTGVPFEWLQNGKSPQPVGPDGGSLPVTERLPHLDSNQEPAGYQVRATLNRPLAA